MIVTHSPIISDKHFHPPMASHHTPPKDEKRLPAKKSIAERSLGGKSLWQREEQRANTFSRCTCAHNYAYKIF
jgi:hypothetical protein